MLPSVSAKPWLDTWNCIPIVPHVIQGDLCANDNLDRGSY